MAAIYTDMGQSLMDLSIQHYGTYARWGDIIDLNPALFAGQAFELTAPLPAGKAVNVADTVDNPLVAKQFVNRKIVSNPEGKYA